jgi:hypothetical protein
MTPLAVELTKLIYANLSDEEAAVAVTEKRVAVRRLVPTYLVRRAACEGLYWSDLMDACESSNVTLKRMARAMMVWVNDTSGTVQTIDMNLPAVSAVMGGFVAYGVITQPQADALIALGTVEIPWTEHAGVSGPIGSGMVHSARLEIENNA